MESDLLSKDRERELSGIHMRCVVDPRPTPDVEAMLKELREGVETILRSLPPAERSALMAYINSSAQGPPSQEARRAIERILASNVRVEYLRGRFVRR